MTFQQLEHAIRAACNLLHTKEVCIVGSQSILAFHPGISGPLAISNEADILPITELLDQDMPPQHAADLINGTLGEDTGFLSTHGFMVEGVVESDVSLPPGWRNRTKAVKSENTNGCIGHCISPNDMAVAKIVAGRTKDRRAVVNLLRQGIVKIKNLRKAIESFEESKLPLNLSIRDLTERLERWHKHAFPEKKIPPGGEIV